MYFSLTVCLSPVRYHCQQLYLGSGLGLWLGLGLRLRLRLSKGCGWGFGLFLPLILDCLLSTCLADLLAFVGVVDFKCVDFIQLTFCLFVLCVFLVAFAIISCSPVAFGLCPVACRANCQQCQKVTHIIWQRQGEENMTFNNKKLFILRDSYVHIWILSQA